MERLVQWAWRRTNQSRNRLTQVPRADIRAIITVARLSAARECAEIADALAAKNRRNLPENPGESMGEVATAIRERFRLEGK